MYLSYSVASFQPELNVFSLSWNFVTWRNTVTFSMKSCNERAWTEKVESSDGCFMLACSASSSSLTQIGTTFSSFEPTR